MLSNSTTIVANFKAITYICKPGAIYGRKSSFILTLLLEGCLVYQIQYCAKLMQAKCANFVFCPRELSSKFRAKVRMTIRGFFSEFSVQQRALFRRIFTSKRKFSETSR